MTDESHQKLSSVAATERVLLLSHCLRPSQTCPGKFEKRGLICPQACEEDCTVGRLRKAALSLGYKGVCVAAGGAMALRFVQEHEPRGIVAVACTRELLEGVESFRGLAQDDTEHPASVLIPLCTDGCVDTEVDEARVQEAIALGCHRS